MIQSREQLIQLRDGWLRQASQDLCNKIITFMEENRTNEAELAQVLALSVQEVRSLLTPNNAQNVTLKEFATLLIATDTVLELKPLSECPQAVRQGMPMPPHGMSMPSHGTPMPPHGMPMPSREPYPTPQRDSRGRFVRRNTEQHPTPQPQVVERPTPQPQAPQEGVNLDTFTRSELVNLVRENGWEDEIDLVVSDRGDIIEFLLAKQDTMAETAPIAEDPATPQTSNDAFARTIIDGLANNPQLRDALRALIG